MALQLQDNVGEFYKYTPITDSGTIRVIKLLPSLDIEADLHCSLECKRLDDFQDGVAGHYTALSYVWGDATDVRIIFVEGKRLEITASLHCALRHIRHTHHASYFWADGTCINQPDVVERNTQVSMMGSIYKTAHRTIIFLGPSCASSTEVMESIASTANSARDFAATPEHLDILSKHILSHPWFTRVWTLQELVLSKNTWVQKGSSRVPWETFSQHVYKHCTYPADTQRIKDLVGIKSTYWNPFRTSSPGKYLYDILRQRRGAGVSDPRDMIFGHLGLLPPTHESAIRSSISVDYSQTLNEILEAVARRIVLDAGDLSLLAEVEKMRFEDRREGLPSWVPDWTVSGPPSRDDDSILFHGHVSDVDRIFGTSHILVARGTYLGSIKTIFPHPKALATDATIGNYVSRQEVLSLAMQTECQPIADAICTMIRETCKRSNVPLWDEESAFAIDDGTMFSANTPSFTFPAEGEREVRQLVTNLYRTSQGANTSLPEHSEVLLQPAVVGVLFETWESVYIAAKFSNTIALLEDGGVAGVASQAREGDLLCHLEGSTGVYVVRPCGKEKDKDNNSRALVPVKGGLERHAEMEKMRQGLGSVEAGRSGEEGGTRGTQMSLDVRLVDVLSDGDLYRSRWLDITFGEDFSTGHEAVFAIH